MSHAADLAEDTAVEARGAGRYAALLPRHWDYFMPSGGVLVTLALRAMVAELGLRPGLLGEDTGVRPLSATAVFCSPVPAGQVIIEVTVLRRGALASQLRASLSPADGELGLELIATFGRERPVVDVSLTAAPAVAEPLALPEIDPADQSFVPPFIRNFDHRRAIGSAWWRADEWVKGDRSGYWYRYLRPQRLPDGRLDPLALPPLIDTMPPAMCAMIGPGARAFVAPSLDLTVHFVQDTRSEWLLTHVHCREVHGGYATADIEIWDEARRLVAYGTQVMILRRRPGGPPGQP
ncbi:MAG: thioesterase family protein [Myxococcales bacterium]|nr:thioesterase family protein [Myxococcales bacterium]